MTEEQRTIAMESLKRDLQNLPTKRDLAWRELQNGVDPAWIAVKYQFPLEKILAAKAELDRRQEAKK